MILGNDRDTISRWLDRWQASGREELADAPRSGRLTKIDEVVETALREIPADPSPDLKTVIQTELEKRG